jgi:endonuclease G
MSGSGNRNDSSFGYDPTVSTSVQANLFKSYNGWYDRGHQLPAADRKCSQEMMDQTFYSTNMTPQQGNFNQNKWGTLEGRVRNMVCSDTLFVVTGAHFAGEHHSSIDAETTDRSGNVCPTPTHYYKALLRTVKGNTGRRIDEISDASQLRAIAFWFEHANTGNDTKITSADCITIEELERRTGFDFFPMIDDRIEAEVQSTITPSSWGINN